MEAKDILFLVLMGAVFVVFYTGFIFGDDRKADNWRAGALFILYYIFFFPFILVKWIFEMLDGWGKDQSRKNKETVKDVCKDTNIIIECSNCGQKLRVPTNIEVDVKCPKCKHEWRFQY